MRGYTLALLVITLAFAACSRHTVQQDQPAPSALPALTELPQSPPRSASALQTQTGDEYKLSGGHIDNPSGLPKLTPAAGELAYCIYEFDSTKDFTATSVEVDVTGIAGSQVWVALSNYDTRMWEFLDPTSHSQAYDLTAPRGTFSNDTHTFVAILVAGPHAITINSIALNLVDPSWTHLYGDGLNNGLTRSEPDGQGGIWAAGYHDEIGNLTLLHIDKDGTVELRHALDSGKSMNALAMATDQAGNVYIAGQSWNQVDGQYFVYPMVIKFSPTGDLLWAREYQHDTEHSFSGTGLVVGEDGHLYFIGSSEVMRQLAAIDSDGDLLWAKTWYNGDRGNPDMALMDGGLYVADVYSDSGPPIPKVGAMFRFDTTGKLKWGRRWMCDAAVMGDIGYETYVRLEKDNAGRLLWAGSNLKGRNKPPLTWHLSLFSFLPDGTLADAGGAEQFGNPTSYGPYIPSGIAIDSLGRVHASLSCLYGGLGSVFTFMPDLTLHKAEFLRSPESESQTYSFYDIDLFGDGDMFICGTGQHIAEASWEDVPSANWTPHINEPSPYDPGITDVSADWTGVPLDLSEVGIDYTIDRDADDMDQLLIRRLF